MRGVSWMELTVADTFDVVDREPRLAHKERARTWGTVT